jgi:hydroxyacylglutathione hydrolase
MEEAARVLHKIGVEQIAGAFDSGDVRSSGLATEVYAAGTPAELSRSISNGEVKIIDVRSDVEWDEGHIEQAEHFFLGKLPDQLDQLQRDGKIVVHCLSGARSAIGVSVLQAAGFTNVINLTGGYAAWKRDGLPSVRSKETIMA